MKVLESQSAAASDVNHGSRVASPVGHQVSTYAVFVRLRVVTGGQLANWMGNAVRGMVLQAIRERYCSLTTDERAFRSDQARGKEDRYCLGCFKNADCLYGRVYEPDRQVIDGTVRNGMRQGLRGITISTEFPIGATFAKYPENQVAVRRVDQVADCHENQFVTASPGDEFVIRLLAIGEKSKSLLNPTLNTLRAKGRTSGLGPDQVRFELDSSSLNLQSWKLTSDDLPTRIESGKIPWLRINLDTPLFLKERQQRPNVAVLFRESLRTVRRAVAEYGAVPDAGSANGQASHSLWEDFDARDMLRASESIECERDSFEPFHQSRISARQDSRWQAGGWAGWAIYRDVPTDFLPWLTWGGRLGISDSRNCGAGLWHAVVA